MATELHAPEQIPPITETYRYKSSKRMTENSLLLPPSRQPFDFLPHFLIFSIGYGHIEHAATGAGPSLISLPAVGGYVTKSRAGQRARRNGAIDPFAPPGAPVQLVVRRGPEPAPLPGGGYAPGKDVQYRSGIPL